MPRFEITDRIVDYGYATYIVCADSEEEAIRKHKNGESEFEGSILSGDWETTDVADEIEEIACAYGCTDCEEEEEEDGDLGDCATCKHWDLGCNHPDKDEEWTVPCSGCCYYTQADTAEEADNSIPPVGQQCRSCVHRDGLARKCDKGWTQDSSMTTDDPDNTTCDFYGRGDKVEAEKDDTVKDNTTNETEPGRQCLDCVYHVVPTEETPGPDCEKNYNQDESVVALEHACSGWANRCSCYTELGDLLKG